MKECKLIVTLPSLNNKEKVEAVFACPQVAEVRFNTGAVCPMPPSMAVHFLQELSKKYHKKVWIDLKGRQLRIKEWGAPMFSCIKLNHEIELDGKARIYLRNGEWCNIMQVIDNYKLFVDPLPRHAVGAGQSVNIIGGNVRIKGYLTETDKQYIEAAKNFGIKSFMLSFVEDFNDIAEVLSLAPESELVLKIESEKGMDFVKMAPPGARYMAARDDLYIQTGLSMMGHLKDIIEKDKTAICASRIFMSLEKGDVPDFSDYEDLEFMYGMGYTEFMLCDNISNYHFPQAVEAWKNWNG